MLDINGLSVITNNAFLAIRHELEYQNQIYQGKAQIINATEAGLGIPGIANWRFREALDRYIAPQSNDVSEMIAAALNWTASGGAGSEQRISGFHAHLLEQIAFIEGKNGDKSALLRKLDKLQKRQLKAGRLNEHMTMIKSINAELGNNGFYKEVILAGLDSVIQYHLLTIKNKFGLQEKSSEAFSAFETFLADTTTRYLTFFKDMVKGEIRQ
jgi:hypothetical protein